MFLALHEKAVAAAKRLKAAEAELIGLLIQIEGCRGFDLQGYPSMFVYVHKGLGLSEASAQLMVFISRKCRDFPQLLEAIIKGELTASKAKAFASILNRQNVHKWIDIARRVSTRDLERLVAVEQPGKPMRESVRYKSTGARIAFDIDEEGLNALNRCREILAQKTSLPTKFAGAVKALAVGYVEREDPVAKADRNARKALHVKRKSSKKHQVHRRDRGRCQFRLPNGELCGARQWLHVHHIKPRAEGGNDEPENLQTLCATHHRQLHRH